VRIGLRYYTLALTYSRYAGRFTPSIAKHGFRTSDRAQCCYAQPLGPGLFTGYHDRHLVHRADNGKLHVMVEGFRVEHAMAAIVLALDFCRFLAVPVHQ
jgi:hypothetical protein